MYYIEREREIALELMWLSLTGSARGGRNSVSTTIYHIIDIQ